MRRLLGFLLGFVLVYLAVAVTMLVLVDQKVIVDRDGGVSMGVIFVIAPIAAFIGGVLGALLAGKRAPKPE